MKPTIAEIARRSGVSRGTVDRVLNDRPYVDAEVRRRVLLVADQLGYIYQKPYDDKKTTKIGFLLTKWEDEYFLRQTEKGIRRAKQFLRSSRMEILIEQMESRSNDEYIRRIYRLAERGAKGILLNAADNIMLSATIADLAAQGIPVITYNSDVSDSRRVCHVGQDLEKSGEVAAGLLVRSLGPKDKILIITGNMEFSAHRRRIDGFFAQSRALGCGTERMLLQECYERYDLTYETILTALRRDETIRGIYMGTESVPACLDALKKRKPRQKIHVVANDLTRPAIKGLKNGRIDFVVEQDFSAQAYEAVLVMHSLLAYGHPPKKEIRYVPTSIYTKELL